MECAPIDQRRFSHDYDDIKRSGAGIDAVPASRNSLKRLQLDWWRGHWRMARHPRLRSNRDVVTPRSIKIRPSSRSDSSLLDLEEHRRARSDLYRRRALCVLQLGRPAHRMDLEDDAVRDALALDHRLAALAVEREAQGENGLAWRCFAGRASATRRPRGCRRGLRGRRGRRPSPVTMCPLVSSKRSAFWSGSAGAFVRAHQRSLRNVHPKVDPIFPGLFD